MSIAKRGSVYDKIIDEKWFSTPDMGEYYSTYEYKSKADEQSDKKGKTEFFVENPPTEIPGYHDELGVVVLKADNHAIHSSYMDSHHTNYNIYDGDTIKLSLNNVKSTSTPFQVYYGGPKFNNVHHYLKESMNLKDHDEFSLRFVGMNTPEIVHYEDYVTSIKEDDIYKVKYKQFKGNNTSISLGVLGTQYPKSAFNYVPYKINDNGSLSERDDNEEITFVKFVMNKKDYPSLNSDERVEFREVVGKGRESSKVKNKLERKCVVVAEYDKDLEYHKESLRCRDIVKEAFSKASDCILVLDTQSLNGKKAGLPKEYKKTFESSTYNPFYSLYDMWKSIKGEKAAYQYAGYRVPGQEANGRFLSAIYLKINGQWINLNKKVMYESDKVEKAQYTQSVDAMVNDYYLAKGFKLWTYDINNQLYIDGISDEIVKTKDDRREIQNSISGCHIEEMKDHTVMIGDCMFMVPPTSIRAISQTKTSKTHLIRSKGSMARTLPKTERIIQMDLFFNGEQGINGVPYTQTLPNGKQRTYKMNGLRALIAQFKLAPFLPVHNTYINDVLNIDAVSLSSYTISTVPNYPRTLQVSLTMQEFDWTQFMPCQAIPENTSMNDLYRNAFSETMHFPTLRYFYQRAIERGDNLRLGSFQNVPPNNKDYIKQTLGNKTALQPMQFTDSLIDFYVPDEKLLAARKQAIIEMKTKPLGRKYNFTENESNWIARCNPLNKLLNSINKTSGEFISKMTDNKNGLNPYLDYKGSTFKSNSYHDLLNNPNLYALIVHGKSPTNIKTSKKDTVEQYLTPAFSEALRLFNANKNDVQDLITGLDINTRKYEANGSMISEETVFFEVNLVFNLNTKFFEDGASLNKIKSFCSKQLGIASENIFKDNKITISYKSEFAPNNLHNSKAEIKKPLIQTECESMEALGYLAALSDSEQEGYEDFDMNEVMENLKDSIDIEDEDSIKFDLFEIGNPIVTSISSSYNNIFTNMSLKAIDGHAAQYTGGTDSSLEIEMIGDDVTVGQLYFLNRQCLKYLIDYRKVIKSSPLRIDSDITRMLGLYEVIIESLDVNTIPDYPGKYRILLKLSSVDRTLRNKEALKKLQDIDNSSTEKDMIIHTKNYFDLKKALGKAELYPDLELPTVEELERAGFFFMKHKYQPERVYPDPDFYYLYWYPTFAQNLRTAITEYFENPENIDYTISNDLFDEVFHLDINVKNNDGQTLYQILDWDNRNESYTEMTKKLSKMSKDVLQKENNMSDSQLDSFTDHASDKLKKLDQTNKILNGLQEAIDNSIYNTYGVNTYTNVTVRDVDVLDTVTKKDEKQKDKVSKDLKKLIKDYLKQPIKGSSPGTVDTNGQYNPYDFFKTASYNDYKDKSRPTATGSENDFNTDGKEMDFAIVTEIANTILGSKKINFYPQAKYITSIIKACGVGAMASEGFLNSSKEDIDFPIKNGKFRDPLCYPPAYSEFSNEQGKIVKGAICLYEDPKTSELLIAHDEETRKKGIVFGRYGIKKFKGEYIAKMFQHGVAISDGFLDPYYHPELHEIILGSKVDKKEMNKRIGDYRHSLYTDMYFATQAMLRQMLVWIYILIEQDSFLTTAQYYAAKLIEIGESGDKFWDNDKLEELSKTLFDFEKDHFESPTAWKTVCNKVDDWRFKDEFEQLLGEGTYDSTKDAIKTQEERVKELVKIIQKNSEEYAKTLVVGLFYTAGAIAMSGFESSILRAVSEGSMSQYSEIISSGLAANSYAGLSEEQKRVSRYVQYLNYYFDEDDRYKKNPITAVTYNNRVQRAYMKAANDPKTYMLHSYYDMVMHDKRGSMARAFPTYYMLLIDEGRNIGLWKLQDNFYDMNSIIEFEVVKSRKIAADTARIVMTNMYGTFNTDDIDMKDEYEYNLKDVWDSIFSPRAYFQEEYVRRENARDVNSAKMQPGARVHLRMGYSSNAADLPIVFNGCVAEFEAGETMTLVCQGDGVELANPHMFNAMDGKDVQDIEHSDDFIGWKKLQETWNNLSTPRDMLVNPMAAEGSWVQELIRKYSNGRFFNSNPFGIVHFGDKKYNEIFTTNGEVEQNIYEALSKPTWDYEKSGINTIEDGIEKEYELSEAPRVKVSLNQGFSYWDLMHIASSLSPDFICAVAPFQLRSTVFHGHPRFYYAYDYLSVDGKIFEKRKPYQQYHVFTSYSDIIDNRMATSQKDIRTNIVGHYTGPGWLSKKPKTVGPLFLDIDIFPEFQKSTSVNLNFEYKNNDILPFNIPVVDKVLDSMDWTDGPNGEKTAWRATASALKDTVKDMYKGELIVMGDPTIKPFDKFVMQDMYEDMAGTAEVEQVVHMFSVDTGFTSSVTPDCIAAIDNKYETINNAINAQVIVPTIAASTLLWATNLDFHKRNRAMYLSIARASKQGQNLVHSLANTALTVIGKEEISRDAALISSNIESETLKSFLKIDDLHIGLSDTIYDMTSNAKRFKARQIKGSKELISACDDFDKLDDIFNSFSDNNVKNLEEYLSNPKVQDTGAFGEYNKHKNEMTTGIKTAKQSSIISGKDLDAIKDNLTALSKTNPEAKKVLDAIGTANELDLSKNKKFLSSMKSLANTVEDLSTSGLGDVAKILSTKSDDIAKGLAVTSKLDDIGKMAGAAKLVKSVKSLLLNNLAVMVAQIAISKSGQNFLVNKLRNLQVLTVFPLKKDNFVWTAGINGHQGSVFGSPSYEKPGWLENLAIKFFDYGNDGGLFSASTYLAMLRDMFITTKEMREIVEGYKRGSNYPNEYQSPDKERISAQNSILETLAKQQTLAYTDYKKIYFNDRLTMKDVSNRTGVARSSYAFYKMSNITDIERTTRIADNLVYVLDNELIAKLYERDAFVLGAEFDKNNTPAEFEKINMKRKKILTADGGKTKDVYVKEIKSESNALPVYDIPYLRPDALIVLHQIIHSALLDIQPDYESPNCEFENLKAIKFILHNGTRINSNAGWRSTGYLFTLEVKNYDNLSNTINKVEAQRDRLCKEFDVEVPFTVKKEQSTEFGNNAYSIFVHCPEK